MIIRAAETELMPKLEVDYTEPDGSKLKNGNGFLKPNFGVGPKPVGLLDWKVPVVPLRRQWMRLAGSSGQPQSSRRLVEF